MNTNMNTPDNKNEYANQPIESYIPLVKFLGAALGPNYEVCLYDVSEEKNCLIAIENGELSGRSPGAPLTDWILRLMSEDSYNGQDFILNAKGISKSGDILRSSTMFIRQGEELTGFLSISCNVSKYERLSKSILDLCNMGVTVKDFEDYQFSETGYSPRVENYAETASEITSQVLKDAAEKFGTPIGRLSYQEKLAVIEELDQRGIFLLKGAVTEVAGQMGSSEASIYRYISKLSASKR